MSLLVSIAKLYVRFVFRDGDYDSAHTQREFNVPDPPRGIRKRTERVDAAKVRAFWIDRQNAGHGVLVYLHGGAYYFGPVKEHWDYIARICRLSGMAGVVIDYGIAPQNPFPIGLEQVIDLLNHLDLPDNWFILGDSSGAGMAVATVFRLRQAGRKLPKRLILMSPWVDLKLTNPEIDLNKHEDVMMTVERLRSAARDYVGIHDPADPLISPIFGDLTGMPPVLIQMGTADLLLADCRRLYKKCLDAGVDAKYEEYPGAFHDFMMLSILPEARRALRSQTAFLIDSKVN